MAARPSLAIGAPTLGAPRRAYVPGTFRTPLGGGGIGAGLGIGAVPFRPPVVAPKPAPLSPEATARAYAPTIRWRLRIPGQHYSGLSNEDLLAVRKREGRDFARDVPSLHAFTNRRLYAAARTWRVWSETRADNVFAEAALEWIVKRVETGGHGDVTLTPLTPAYAEKKRRAGKGGEPIGVWHGRWLRALKRGHVEVIV